MADLLHFCHQLKHLMETKAAAASASGLLSTAGFVCLRVQPAHTTQGTEVEVSPAPVWPETRPTPMLDLPDPPSCCRPCLQDATVANTQASERMTTWDDLAILDNLLPAWCKSSPCSFNLKSAV